MKYSLSSPGGVARIDVELDLDGRLQYDVRFRDREVIRGGRLAIDLRPGGLLAEGLELVDSTVTQSDETYPIIAGKAAEARNHYNELTLKLRESTGTARQIVAVFRAYDDGVAFRYVIPEQEGLRDFTIIGERSEFRFTADHECWPTTYPHFLSTFEMEFPQRKLSHLKPGALVGLPLTIQIDNGPAVAITEANLTNYAGCYLDRLSDEELTLVTRLAPLHDGAYGAVRARAPHASPWRIIQLADQPVKLIESNILYNLNEPCAITDTSWIKPGRVTWDWWSGRVSSGGNPTPGMNTATMLDYINFAAELKLEYFLLDGGWYDRRGTGEADVLRTIPDIDLPRLIQNAHQRGVDMMLWMHWKDIRNDFERPFAHYQQLGIKGLKVDFFDRDDQDIVVHARRLIETAARHELLIDLHGVFKPTGIERTWPNLMTHEGVMGAEYNKWSSRVTPEYNVSIPFTRMLAGPMDYTPGAFRNVTREQFVARHVAPMVMGTRCHNLAMFVVYQSALQMVSDYPDAIRHQPGADFLKVVPAAWDQTVGLAGEVGQYIVVARRKGPQWFLGAMTNSTGRDLTVPLDFLEEGEYRATIYADGPNAAKAPVDVAISQRTVRSTDRMVLSMAPAGGCAIHLQPAP